ncbi:hypothetical protein [Hyunsoonleella rubra]|uniref:YqaJ viral recombinase domain-containing protein n=1 Tax=Hyunsoonleella rubra TaxID=1737062 RepID=A0ABW5TB95_9FLAO
MLKNIISYHNNLSNELRTNFLSGYCHKNYLSSIFTSEDFEYFWNHTEWHELEKKYIKESIGRNSFGLRYNNISDLIEKHYKDFDGNPSIYFPDGLKVVEVKMPYAKLNFNKWTSTIKQIGIQFYWLNPTIKRHLLYYYLHQTVLTYVTFPKNEDFLDYRLRHIKGRIGESISYYSLITDEIHSKVKAITDQILETPFDRIIPKENRKVHFLNNPDYDLSPKELKEYQNEIQGKVKVDKTSAKIKELILNWDFINQGIITKDKLASILNISCSTITRRWKPYVELKEELNSQYLQNAA